MNNNTDKLETIRLWLEKRKTVITSTDLASILQVEGAYSSPMGIYMDKKTPVMPEDMEDESLEYMRWGQLLQIPIIREYSRKVRAHVVQADPYALEVLKGEPLGCSLDAYSASGDRVIEAKNVGIKGEDWGMEGTSQVPQKFYIQVQAQMLVTGKQLADIAVLFSGRKLGIYRVEADPDVQAGLLDAAQEFWNKHILPDVPPVVDGSSEWDRYLRSRPQKTDRVVQVTDDNVISLGRKLAHTRARITELEGIEAETANLIKEIIGTNEGIFCEEWKATFKTRKGGEKVDWQLVAKNMAKMYSVPEEEVTKFAEAATKHSAGTRVFLFKEAKSGDR